MYKEKVNTDFWNSIYNFLRQVMYINIAKRGFGTIEDSGNHL